jgi:hypothetical protein
MHGLGASMKIWITQALAAAALLWPVSNADAAPQSRAVAEQKLVDDARELADWMAKLLSAQEKAIGVLTPIDLAWAELQRVSPNGDQEAVDGAYDQIDAAIGNAKLSLAEAKAAIDALPSLTSNKVMKDMPVGHEDRLRKFAADTILQFSNIVAQGETMTAAMASGDRAKVREFSDLMLGAREELIYGQISRIEIMTAAAKRGSVNELRLTVLGKATEAMHILFKGQVNILREKPADFNLERLSAIGTEMTVLAQQGRVAQKSELAQFAREKRKIIPAMIPINERLFVLNAEWLDYVDTLPQLFAEIAAEVPAAGDDLDKLDLIFSKVVGVEDEYILHSNKQVANLQGV